MNKLCSIPPCLFKERHENIHQPPIRICLLIGSNAISGMATIYVYRFCRCLCAYNIRDIQKPHFDRRLPHSPKLRAAN